MEKRRESRLRKKYMVRFGENDFERLGFTGDLSKKGMFITSSHVITPNSPVQILFHHDDRVFSIQGVVKWSLRYPGRYSSYVPIGMGVEIKKAPGDYYRFVDEDGD